MKQKLRLILLTGMMTFLNAFAGASADSKPVDDGCLVNIGGGRTMYLESQGTGCPTVVLVSGCTDRSTIWKTLADPTKPGPTVYPEVAKFTRVCAYDRPGTVTITGDIVTPSRSTSVPQPVTPKDSVEDLHALLTAAKVPGPYVLVGHSYGGLIVRLYASIYPDDVAGLVLIDSVTEFLYDALTEEQKAMWLHMLNNYSPDLDRYTIQERTDFVKGFEQMRKSAPLRPMPVIVLTSDETYDLKSLIAAGALPSDIPLDFGPIAFQAHLNGQNRLARILHAKHITNTHSGHYIHVEQPQLVIDAIKEIVYKVRADKSSKCAK